MRAAVVGGDYISESLWPIALMDFHCLSEQCVHRAMPALNGTITGGMVGRSPLFCNTQQTAHFPPYLIVKFFPVVGQGQVGAPRGSITCSTRPLATVVAFLSRMGHATTYLVKEQIHVQMQLNPDAGR